MKSVRFRYASPLISHASPAQLEDALASNARCSPFESEAMHHIYVPVVQMEDTASLNLALMHVQIVPGTPNSISKTILPLSPSPRRANRTVFASASRHYRFRNEIITRLAQLVEATALEAVRSEFESPGGYQFFYASVAQWIRALAYEARGCRFESCRARHIFIP
jgi:hypothetical protein